jgi:hypothetical protein
MRGETGQADLAPTAATATMVTQEMTAEVADTVGV